MDYYKNTIADMKNELDFFYRCKKFEYIQDFEIVFIKNYDALMVYEVLDSDVYLYEIDLIQFYYFLK